MTEEARVFMALGHNDRAIEVLQDHIRRLPRSMPAAWLMLLDLYHAGMATAPNSASWRMNFHTHFNVRGAAVGSVRGRKARRRRHRRLPAHRAAGGGAVAASPECRAYLERLLYDNREGPPQRIPAVDRTRTSCCCCKCCDAPSDSRHRRGSGRRRQARSGVRRPLRRTLHPPTARSATAEQKPMPPDPAASRPAQQPIRFEIEPPDSGERRSPSRITRRYLARRIASRIRSRARLSRAESRGAPFRRPSGRASP